METETLPRITTLPPLPRADMIGLDAAVDRGNYQDAYLRALNEIMPVSAVMGDYQRAIAGGHAQVLNQLVRDHFSDLDHSMQAADLVMRAAIDNIWAGIDRSRRPLLLDEDEVVTRNYAFTREYEGTTFLIPSFHFATHVLASLEELNE